MRHRTLKTTTLLLALVIGGASFAQKIDKTKSTDNKDKLDQYDEIVIKKKSDKDSKVTIEINNGDVKVNGKDLSEFDDENISIRRKKIVVHGEDGDMVFAEPMPPLPPKAPRSPFRYNYNYNFKYDDGNKGFLGVVTEKENGAKITQVNEGTPAAKAGLKVGDIITKVDEVKITSPEELSKAIGSYKPDEKVTLTYTRNKKALKTTATLGKREGGGTFAMPPGDFNVNLDDLKLNLDQLKISEDVWKSMNDNQNFYFKGPNNPKLGIKAQDTEDGKGVKVLEVEDSSNAAKAGIKAGDIITSFDGKDIQSAEQLIAAFRQAGPKSNIPVKINRDGILQDMEIKIPKKLRTANL